MFVDIVNSKKLVAEVLEAEGDRKIFGAALGHDFLEIVAAFASDADVVAHDLGGDFEFGVADEAGDLLGGGGVDALLDDDLLAGVAEGGNVGIFAFDVFEADLAFGQFVHEDFVEGGDFELILGGEIDLVFFEFDFGF